MTATSAIRHPLWAALRHRDEPASVPELAQAVGVPDSSIAWRLSRWTKAGLLEAIKPANEAGDCRTTYIMPDASRVHTAPPSLNAQLRPSVKRGGRAAMWRAMRVMKSFDLVQLVMTANVSISSAKTYVSALLRAGILRRDVRGDATTGQRSIYTLNGRFGPKPAVVSQRKAHGRTVTTVTDPNSGSIREISELPPCAPLF